MLKNLVITLIISSLAEVGLSKEQQVDVSIFNELLSTHVRANGGVDYQGVAKDEKKLDAFIASFSQANLTKSSDNEKKASYINLYNALMIRSLLRYAKSEKIDLNSKDFLNIQINDIDVSGGNIWNTDDRKYHAQLGGRWVNLDTIEHELIRGKVKGDLKLWQVSTLDPRIHVAVNCAAKSCPRLREKAYTAQNIDQMLDENMREYVNSSKQFKQVSQSKLKLNSIVFWYYPDFDDTAKTQFALKGAGDYLGQFVDKKTPGGKWKDAHLRQNFNDRSRISLKFSSAFDFAYDWIVNDIRNMAD